MKAGRVHEMHIKVTSKEREEIRNSHINALIREKLEKRDNELYRSIMRELDLHLLI